MGISGKYAIAIAGLTIGIIIAINYQVKKARWIARNKYVAPQNGSINVIKKGGRWTPPSDEVKDEMTESIIMETLDPIETETGPSILQLLESSMNISLPKSRVKRVRRDSIQKELDVQNAMFDEDGIVFPDGIERNVTEETLILDCYRCLSNARTDQEPVCDTESWNAYDHESKEIIIRTCLPGTEYCVKIVHERYEERTTERGCMGRGKIPGPKNTIIPAKEGCVTVKNPPNITTVCFCKHSRCNQGAKVVLSSLGFISILITMLSPYLAF